MLAIELFGGAICVDVFQFAVPPDVPPLLDVNFIVGAAQHDHPLNFRTLLQRVVHVLFQGDNLSATIAAVGGDDHLRATVVDAVDERLRAESTEDDRVRRPDAGAGEHRDGRLGNHRHVDDDAVAFDDAVALEHIGEPARLAVEVGVGEHARFAGIAKAGGFALPDDCGLVATRAIEMAVEAVVRKVDLSADEPFCERLVPLQEFLPRFEPVKFLRHARPEFRRRLDRFGVELAILREGFDVGLFGERSRRFEFAAFFLQRSDVGLRHERFSRGQRLFSPRILAKETANGQAGERGECAIRCPGDGPCGELAGC